MMPKTKKNNNDAVAQAWKDYEGNVVRARKPYKEALAKAMKESKDRGGSV